MTIKEAFKRYFPEELRYAILVQSYGSEIDFSKKLFKSARKRMYYFYQTLKKNQEMLCQSQDEKNKKILKKVAAPSLIVDLESKFIDFMNGNFNTTKVLALTADVFKELNKTIASSSLTLNEKASIIGSFQNNFKGLSSVLGLFEEDPTVYLQKIKNRILLERGVSEKDINKLIKKRSMAKLSKDWVAADKIKRELLSMGISLEDSPRSVKWEIVFN